MIRLLLADDHRIFLDGLSEILVKEQDFQVVGMTTSAPEILPQISQRQPNVVVLDVHMPGTDGISIAHSIKEQFPEVKVLMLTMATEKTYIEKAIEAGASGYLLKNAEKAEFLLAIRKVARNENYYGSTVTEQLLFDKGNSLDISITERELEVLQLIAKGFTSPEIADQLFISEHTVKSHRKKLQSKIQARNTADLVRFALENKLI